MPPRDRDIAMVFQSYALYPHMTVHDNMAFGLKMRGTPREEIKRRVSEAANILGLGPLLKRKPRQLSGGQRHQPTPGEIWGRADLRVKSTRVNDQESRLRTSRASRNWRRENRELRRANEILKAASAFFARELDPRPPK